MATPKKPALVLQSSCTALPFQQRTEEVMVESPSGCHGAHGCEGFSRSCPILTRAPATNFALLGASLAGKHSIEQQGCVVARMTMVQRIWVASPQLLDRGSLYLMSCSLAPVCYYYAFDSLSLP
jgi:hypothetical protein